MNIVSATNRTRRLDSRVEFALKKYGLDYEALKEWIEMIEGVEGECPELHQIMKVEFAAAGGVKGES